MRQLLKVLMFIGLLAAPGGAAEVLRYQGTVGRVTEYRLTFSATGHQVSLGVRRLVRVTAEYALREEVVAVEGDGSLRLRVSGRAVRVKDGTGAFGGPRATWPTMCVHLSPRGEVLEAAPAEGEGTSSLAARAAAWLAQPRPVLLPEGPVEVGASWEWEREGAKQTNRLVSVTEGPPRVARIAAAGRTPLNLREASAALGLTVEMTGEESGEGEAEFSPEQGRVLRHKGKAVLQTKTQVTMETTEGNRTFPMELEVRVAYELRVVAE